MRRVYSKFGSSYCENNILYIVDATNNPNRKKKNMGGLRNHAMQEENEIHNYTTRSKEKASTVH